MLKRLPARRRRRQAEAARRGRGEDRARRRRRRRRRRSLNLKNEYASPHLEVTSVKLFVDGVIETGTAALLEAYVGSN